MSLSKSAPNLDTPVATDVSTGVSNKSQPDFVGIVRFLVAPFLTASTALSVDCEYRANGSRVWIRLAFDGEDRGRVLGRGGRNIQAIRTVIKAIAALSGLQAHLEVYGESSARPEREENGPDRPARSQLPRPKKAN
ncbi:MAG: KH domain-containing protein [Leptolyngbyaceae cyanobacterium SL_1_1]|nr:KH domain-containing protein [Leptolyngbyaceae cyanobacterium RM1_1_2]NJO08712.1 KH domain-containing protein [Leptolyngbyaceae cyanobacterium SL_1_1]